MADGGVDLPPPILDRERMRAEIAADPAFDVVVVGGGITGAGTFRDLCLQGLRVLLVERDDIAGGASGALTRIAHGGFRYLERGDIGLVRDAVTERNRLVANAPHAVAPIRVVLPLTSWFGGLLTAPLRFLRLMGKGKMPGMVPMAIGQRLYDALAAPSRALPRGKIAAGPSLRRDFPYLAGRFSGALSLGEARVRMPERVAIELIEDGVAAGHGSAAFNYCPLVGVDGTRLSLHDRITGTDFVVSARAVVNASGAHADKIASLFGIDERMTGGVAGTHLVLEAPGLAERLGDDLLFFEDDQPDPAKRRLLVCYRLGAGRVLLGTTETACDDPDEARVTPADERYLLQGLAAALPGPATAKMEIVAHMIGVRPLVRSSAESLASRSRDHAVFVHPRGGLPVVTIVGGKWTTFRRMAEDAADAVLKELGRPRLVSTEELPIGGGRDYPQGEAARRDFIARVMPRLDPQLAARLLDIYGSRAVTVALWVAARGSATPIQGSALTEGEIAFFHAAELATSTDDVIRRRSDAWIHVPASS